MKIVIEADLLKKRQFNAVLSKMKKECEEFGNFQAVTKETLLEKYGFNDKNAFLRFSQYCIRKIIPKALAAWKSSKENKDDL